MAKRYYILDTSTGRVIARTRHRGTCEGWIGLYGDPAIHVILDTYVDRVATWAH